MNDGLLRFRRNHESVNAGNLSSAGENDAVSIHGSVFVDCISPHLVVPCRKFPQIDPVQPLRRFYFFLSDDLLVIIGDFELNSLYLFRLLFENDPQTGVLSRFQSMRRMTRPRDPDQEKRFGFYRFLLQQFKSPEIDGPGSGSASKRNADDFLRTDFPVFVLFADQIAELIFEPGEPFRSE